MSYCLNPHCKHPENTDQHQFCISCGSKLWLGDRYRIIRPLTKGKTFLGRDELDFKKSFCIIKQIDHRFNLNNLQQSQLEFEKEALKLKEISQHPQIPNLLAYFTPTPQQTYGNLPILVQEYIEGESINQEIFDEKSIIELLKNILSILQFIHQHNILHRDINPSNIIRKKDSKELILVDFSTAKITSKTALAKTGTVIGSAAYTAPEQLRGKTEFASDIYSLGVTCINLLTGMHPFDLFSSLDGISVWKDYLTEAINSKLINIINKMIADKISQRYQSALEVLTELSILTGEKNLGLSFKIEPKKAQLPDNFLNPSWQCTKTLNGHLNSIHSLIFNADGNILISASADQTLKIWEVNQQQELKTLRGHQSIIESVIFTPDQKFLISASWDYTIKIWASQTGEYITQFKDHNGWINCLTISNNGKFLISGSTDQTLKIWELPEGVIKFNLKLENNYIKSLAFSPVDQLFATGNNQGVIVIRELNTAKEIMKLEGHQSIINSLVFSPSGQLLFSASGDQTIKIWNIKTGKLLNNLTGHNGEINCIALNNQGNLLISGSADQTIRIWQPSTGELLTNLVGHSSGVKAIAIHPQKMLFASGSQDKSIKIWQFNN